MRKEIKRFIKDFMRSESITIMNGEGLNISLSDLKIYKVTRIKKTYLIDLNENGKMYLQFNSLVSNTTNNEKTMKTYELNEGATTVFLHY